MARDDVVAHDAYEREPPFDRREDHVRIDGERQID
jgi:hypothetical protein